MTTQLLILAPLGSAKLSAIENIASRPMMRKFRYCRQTDLPSLLPLWPHEITVNSPAEHRTLLQRLRKALRAERQRGISGHWCYDLMRHSNLLMAYRAEKELYKTSWPTSQQTDNGI